MLIDELKAITGPKGWMTDPAELQPHLREGRGVATGSTLIRVSPESPSEVAAIVTACAAKGAGIVPQGGNTGLCGGAIPDSTGSQVLLSLERLNKIRSIDPADFSMVAEAGCILADLQATAQSANRLFPLSLGAEGSCQIGGNLSTNAGGINVIRYGTARQQVLGLEVVLADGTVWNGLRSVRKDTAGYDVKQLFLGSEGTLGIITAATLRLYPQIGETATTMIALQSAGQAIEILARLRQELADQIQAFELLSDRCLRIVCRHLPNSTPPFDKEYPWTVLIEAAVDDRYDIFEAALMRALDDGLASDVIIAKNAAEADRFWHLRHAISDAQKHEGLSLKHDVSVPIGRIDEFLRQGQQLLTSMSPEARLVAFGHVGDGNIHFDVLQPREAEGMKFLSNGKAITAAIYALVADLGGSISAEHGIGAFKRDALQRHRSHVELGLMQTLKKALDPANTLNPGKVI